MGQGHELASCKLRPVTMQKYRDERTFVCLLAIIRDTLMLSCMGLLFPASLCHCTSGQPAGCCAAGGCARSHQFLNKQAPSKPGSCCTAAALPCLCVSW